MWYKDKTAISFITLVVLGLLFSTGVVFYALSTAP